MKKKYAKVIKTSIIKRLIFRIRLKNDALNWYQRLNINIRNNWIMLFNVFEMKFKLKFKTK